MLWSGWIGLRLVGKGLALFKRDRTSNQNPIPQVSEQQILPIRRDAVMTVGDVPITRTGKGPPEAKGRRGGKFLVSGDDDASAGRTSRWCTISRSGSSGPATTRCGASGTARG